MKQIKINKIKTFVLTLIAGVTLSLSSCSTKKQTITTSAAQTITVNTPAQASQQLASLLSAYRPWQSMRMPVTVQLLSPTKASVSGSLTLYRDRAIQLSLRYFGFEIGSLQVANDTITIIDKIHKSYASEPLANFLSDFPITISSIQNILLGIPISTTNSDYAAYDTSIISPSQWSLSYQTDQTAVGYLFSAPATLSSLIIKQSDHNPFIITYAPTVDTQFGPFTQSTSIAYAYKRTNIEATLSYNINRTAFNNDCPAYSPTKIKSDYHRLSPDEITALLSHLQ